MIITEAELIGLATISGGGQLPGVPVTVSGTGSAIMAMHELQAKGVVGSDRRVTKLGAVPVRAVEQYWKADRHVFVNQVRSSLNEDGALTVLCPAAQGWNLLRVSPISLMVALVQAYPFLGLGGTDGSVGQWRTLTVDQWAAERGGNDPASLLIVHDRSARRRVSTTVAYDLRNGGGFAYDIGHERGRRVPVWQARVALAGLLGCAPSAGLGDDNE
jgi:hypothetical protein